MQRRLCSSMAFEAAANRGAGSTKPGGNCCAGIRMPATTTIVISTKSVRAIAPPVESPRQLRQPPLNHVDGVPRPILLALDDQNPLAVRRKRERGTRTVVELRLQDHPRRA